MAFLKHIARVLVSLAWLAICFWVPFVLAFGVCRAFGLAGGQ